MTITQLLLLGTGALTIVLAAMLLHSAAVQRRRRVVEVGPAFREVGTFGSLRDFGTDVMLPPNRDTPRSAFILTLVAAGLIGSGVVVKHVWDETHPDIRSAYGRAYERCVAKDKVSRWDIEKVRRCVYSRHPY
jgi:hypothetical protein